MKRITIFLLACLMTLCINAQKPGKTYFETDLANDAQALEFCESHNNSYVVIVWPRGYSCLDYIITKLNEHASVKYVKKMALKKPNIFLLYQKLHKSMSHKSAKKYFRPYISASSYKPLPMAALVLSTDAPLEMILALKKEIRDQIGESYYSIHINDRYSPETIEAAHAVFQD